MKNFKLDDLIGSWECIDFISLHKNIKNYIFVVNPNGYFALKQISDDEDEKEEVLYKGILNKEFKDTENLTLILFENDDFKIELHQIISSNEICLKFNNEEGYSHRFVKQ